VRQLWFVVLAACGFHRGSPFQAGDGATGDTPSSMRDGGGGSGGSDASPDAPGWAFKRQLTINNAGLSALTDFPVLVVLNSSRIRYSTTGADLRFTDTSANPLAYEIETWNPAGTSYVWVKIPAIAAGTTTSFWMLHSNPAASDAQTPTAVWDASFVGVWHLVDAHDSTGKNTSTNSGATATTGQIGGAMAFDGGASHYIDTGYNSNLSHWTIEAWGKPTNGAAFGSTASAWVARFPNYLMLWDCYTSAFCHTVLYNYNSGANTASVSYSATTGAWNYLVGTYDGATLSSIVGGSSTNSVGNANTPTGSTYSAKIGAREDLSQPAILGSIDEVRISSIARSADWIKATYKTGTDAYLTYGAEQAN
jgi:hypothetical protein